MGLIEAAGCAVRRASLLCIGVRVVRCSWAPWAVRDVDWLVAWLQDGQMDSTPRPVLPGEVGPPRPGEPEVRRSGRRRRPTGASPPLPRSIQPTGVWWAAAAVVLVVLAEIAFGPARRSLGVAVTVWDDAVVRWLAGLRLPGMTGVMESIVGFIGSAGMVSAFRWETVIALLVLRRFRHLIVFVGSFLAVLLAVRLATVDRPRPFGVELRTSWGGWAMPSRPVAIFAATLVGMLYTLVPVGRWRQLGKWVATGLVAIFALARIHLGVDAPTDALLGAVIGVAVSVAAYRLFVPNEIFPVTYRRGRSAHLDVGGRRGEAIRQALADQLGLTALEVEPFGLSGLGRVDATADPGPGRGRHDPPCLRQAVRQEPSPRRPLLQVRPGAAVRAAGGREAVQHRQAAGPAGGLRAGPDAAGRPAQPRAVRGRRAHP